MEYQKIINLVDNTPNQSFKFSTKKCAAIDDDSRETYKTNGSQSRFQASMLKSGLYDYCGTCILAKETITVNNTGMVTAPNKIEKK